MTGKINIGDLVGVDHLPGFSGPVSKITGGLAYIKHPKGMTVTPLETVTFSEKKEMPKNVLLIDWSTIAYPAWEKMKNKGYISETSSEIVEFTRNIAQEAVYLIERFAPGKEDEVFFLLDAANWRVPYYRSYYNKFLKTYRVRHKETKELGFLFMHDTYRYLIWDTQEPKDRKKGFKLPEVKLSKKAWEEVKNSLQRRPVDDPYSCDRIKDLLPTYKGNRKTRKWDYDTNKETFKKIRNQSAINLGKTLKAKVVEVDWCEADDLVYAGVVQNGGHNITCVSSDSDLDQCHYHTLFYRRWTPEPKRREFIELGTVEEVQLSTFKKVLSGDSGDNIKPVTLGTSTIGPKPAEKLAAVGTYEELEDVSDHPSLKRNMKLVLLDWAPSKVLAAAADGIRNAKIPEGEAIHINKYGIEKSSTFPMSYCLPQVCYGDLEE
jgi:hypothetical protein